ncbi:hypothetical protein [Pontixanthobacter luteolus]|uniref:hypothetical protein n=1 Tax=Pontixanthobacter luteolus TaxID=295089 RepID=UPI0023021BCE|nr:hypothetical protein [Pontixanthobacter luteolus]
MDMNIFADVVQVVTAIGALFVAGWSFLTSRKMASIQRTHNHQSFRPIPYLRQGNFKSGFSLELANEGVGPLIIDRVMVRLAAENLNVPDFVSLLEPEKDPVFWDRYAQKLKGRTVPPQKAITLLSLFNEGRENDPEYDAQFNAVSKAARTRLSKTLFRLEYSDIYGNPFTYHVALDWMAPENAGLVDQGALEADRDELGSDIRTKTASVVQPRDKA